MNLFFLLSLSLFCSYNTVTADVRPELGLLQKLYNSEVLKNIAHLKYDEGGPSIKQTGNVVESELNEAKGSLNPNGEEPITTKRILKKRAAQNDSNINQQLENLLTNLGISLSNNNTDLSDLLSNISPEVVQNVLQFLQGSQVSQGGLNISPEIVQNVLQLLQGIQGSQGGLNISSDVLQNIFQRLQGNSNAPVQASNPFQVITQIGQSTLKPYSPSYTSSRRCTTERTAVMTGLAQGQLWAITMLDSVGKLGTGLAQGNTWLLGNFDECLSVSGVTSEGDVIKGSFVEYSIKLTLPEGIPPSHGAVPFQRAGLPFVLWHVCLPSGCNEKDAHAIGHQFAREIDATLTSSKIIRKKDPSDDTAFIIAIIVLADLALTCIIGTAIDVTMGKGKPVRGWKKFFLAFSLYKNIPDIVKAKHAPGDIGCLHGIRVISISWVILGHAYFFAPQYGNFLDYFEMTKQWTYNAIINGTRAVDTFFLLSGCLVAYLFLRTAEREGGVKAKSMVLYYVHRFLRLTPLYALAILVYTGITPYMEHGPFQDKNYGRDIVCRDKWWWNLLYINNLRDDAELCLGWSWYLSNDMQFYIVAPLVLIPLAFGYKFIGLAVASLKIALHFGMCAWMHLKYDTSMYKNSEKFMAYIYFKPYTRIGPYAIGLILGYLLFKTKCKIRMNKIVVLIGWILAVGGGLTNIYVTQDNTGENGAISLKWSDDELFAYDTVKRPFWAACVAWLIFACATGFGGAINSFLSWQAWIPLSRLTFGTYLSHVWVYYYFNNNARTLRHMGYNFVIERYLVTFILAYAISFILSLLIETPVRNLIKPAKKQPQPAKSEPKADDPEANGHNVYTLNGKVKGGVLAGENGYTPEPVTGFNGVDNATFQMEDCNDKGKIIKEN